MSDSLPMTFSLDDGTPRVCMFCGKPTGRQYCHIDNAIVGCSPECVRLYQRSPIGLVLRRIEILEAQVQSLQLEASRGLPKT